MHRSVSRVVAHRALHGPVAFVERDPTRRSVVDAARRDGEIARTVIAIASPSARAFFQRPPAVTDNGTSLPQHVGQDAASRRQVMARRQCRRGHWQRACLAPVVSPAVQEGTADCRRPAVRSGVVVQAMPAWPVAGSTGVLVGIASIRSCINQAPMPTAIAATTCRTTGHDEARGALRAVTSTGWTGATPPSVSR